MHRLFLAGVLMLYYALPLITSTSAFSEIVTRLANNVHVSNDPVSEAFRSLIFLPQGYGSVTTAIYDQISTRNLSITTSSAKG